MKAAFLCSLGHEDMIRMSFDPPCSLCPVAAVHMFTGKIMSRKKRKVKYVCLFEGLKTYYSYVETGSNVFGGQHNRSDV